VSRGWDLGSALVAGLVRPESPASAVSLLHHLHP